MTATQHLVVDGSNIATEGRSTPSLDQLEGAVAELRKELPEAEVTVVVDATFAHRIDPVELPRFEAAALRGEFVYPPAGAIGRGDAFLLRIAQKVDGVVLSNDSFQEFHGEHEWLFERGRLLGATPVPGIGWIFVPRTPVRGPKSRVATRDAKRAKVRVEKAIAVATKEVVEPERPPGRAAGPAPRSRSRATASGSPQAVNDPTTFITFIAEHRLGEEIEAEVESFSSHGAVGRYGDVRCYLPLAGLGDPAPRSAREVFHKGDRRTFVITALDPYRRGVELALPGVGVVSGRPSEETVAAEVRMARSARRPAPAYLPANPKIGDSAPAPGSRPLRPARRVAAQPEAGASSAGPAPGRAVPTKARRATKAAPAEAAAPDESAPAVMGPAKAVKAAKAGGTTRSAPAKATAARKAAPAKATGSARTGSAGVAKSAPAKAPRAAKAGRATKATKAAKDAEAAAPTKATGSTKATGPAKAARTAKAPGPTKAAKAGGTTRSAPAKATAARKGAPAEAAAPAKATGSTKAAGSARAAKSAPAKAARPGRAPKGAGTAAAGESAAAPGTATGAPRRSPRSSGRSGGPG